MNQKHLKKLGFVVFAICLNAGLLSSVADADESKTPALDRKHMPSPYFDKPISSLVISADGFGEIGDYKRALALYKKIETILDKRISISKHDPDDFFRKCRISYLEGRLEQFAGDDEKADSCFQSSYSYAVEALGFGGNSVEASKLMEQALIASSGVKKSLDEPEMAEQVLTKALTLCDETLKLNPKDSITLNLKERAFNTLGSIQNYALDSKKAAASFQTTIEICDNVLEGDPNQFEALLNRSIAELGLVRMNYADTSSSLIFCTNALSDIKNALPFSEDIENAGIDETDILIERGRLLARLPHYADAQNVLINAISLLDQKISKCPHNAKILLKKIVALQTLAEVESDQWHISEALQTLRQSVAVCDVILSRFPQNVSFLTAKAFTLQQIVRIEATKLNRRRSKELTGLVSFCDMALKKAPASRDLSAVKASTLCQLVCFQQEHSNFTKAMKTYESALKLSDEIIQKWPGFSPGYTIKAELLSAKADSLVTLSEYTEAISLYKKVGLVRSAQTSLGISGSVGLQAHGASLANEANVKLLLDEPTEALNSYLPSLVLLDLALSFSPNDQDILQSKATTLMGQAKCFVKLGSTEGVRSKYEMAVRHCDLILQSAPLNYQALSCKSEALMNIAIFLRNAGQNAETQDYLDRAFRCSRLALQESPKDSFSVLVQARILIVLGELDAKRNSFSCALTRFDSAITLLKTVVKMKDSYRQTARIEMVTALVESVKFHSTGLSGRSRKRYQKALNICENELKISRSQPALLRQRTELLSLLAIH